LPNSERNKTPDIDTKGDKNEYHDQPATLQHRHPRNRPEQDHPTRSGVKSEVVISVKRHYLKKKTDFFNQFLLNTKVILIFIKCNKINVLKR
jgi:hypothetical protein